MKTTFKRLGLIVAAVWLVAGMAWGFVENETTRYVALGGAVVLTAIVVGAWWWVRSQAKSMQGVQAILAGIESDDDRKVAISKLESQFGKGDAVAVFAKAQLLMQDDPQAALQELESINLNKVLPTVADEARSQRALIHLMLGQASPARVLVDSIELGRHNDIKSRTMMASVTAEAWARTGHAKKAAELLVKYPADGDSFEQIKPQVLRAQAFTAAYTNDTKQMRKALRALQQINPQLLGGFFTKRVHPMLQKEAKQVLEQSGEMPRQHMRMQRR